MRVAAPRQIEGDDLTGGVHPGIRTSGAAQRPLTPAEAAQRLLEFSLDRPASALPLKSGEIGAVVGKDRLVSCEFRLTCRHGADSLAPGGPYSSTSSK